MAIGMSSRGGARIRVIVLHTAEGARTKESLYAYFDKPGVNASSHVGIDGRGISPQWVPDHMASWTLRSGNPYSLNAELCGFARWTREQWLHTGWVDGCWNPREMIRNAARWTVREAREHQIPLRLLSIAQFRAGKAGSIDHDLYTDATHDGTHWDVGEGFPFDVFMADVRRFSGTGGGAAAPTQPDLSEDDMPRIDLPTGKHAISFQIPKGARRLAVNCPHGDMRVTALFFSGDRYPAGEDKWGMPHFDFKGDATAGKDKTIDRLRPWRLDVPEGATNGALYYDYPKPDERYEYVGSLDFI